MIRILHVDDDSSDQELTRFNLGRLADDIRVEWAESGRRALDMLASADYDAILCDYQMPEMTGLELLTKLRGSGDKTPFIFLTGQGNEEIAAQALRKGASDYFTKDAGFAHYDRLLNSVRLNVEAKAHRDKHRSSVKKIERLNRVLKAIRDINQLITKEGDISRVLQGACELLVEMRGYKSAWVAIQGDDGYFVKLVGAGAGMDFDQLRDRLFRGETLGCVEKALSQPGVALMESSGTECLDCPLADPEDRDNTLVVRLEHESIVSGVLGVSLDAGVLGDREERELLAELASDIAFALHKDILVKARTAAEEALRESEAQVRMKLESILSPEGDIGTLELADIVDIQALQAMMDEFYRLTHIGIGIIDLRGQVLVATGWQDICTNYHRIHPETHKYCLESDIELSRGVEPGTFKIYKCKNNLWDIATPIIVGGKHMGNIFLGQFFYSDEKPEIEKFRAQARRYGFDEKEYLAALERVPRWSRETVDAVMSFYTRLAGMLSELSYSNIKLARTLSERDGLLESLRQREGLLNTTQRLTKIGGWEWDAEKQSIFWTDETYRIHDLEPGEIEAGLPDHIASSLECYDSEDRPVILTAFRRCVEEGQAYDMEFPFTTTTGRRLWIRTTAQAEKNDDKIVRVVGTIMDITEQKLAEGAYLSNRRMLEDLMSNLPGMVYRCRNDRAWTMEFVSDGCKPLTGFAAEDLIDNRKVSYADLIHSEDREMVWREVQAALKIRQPFRLIYRILTAEGEEKWVWEMGKGILSAGGELEALEGFITDISDRVRMEKDMRNEELRLKTILSSMPVGILLIDAENGLIMEANPAAAGMIGVSADQLKDQSCEEIISFNFREYLESDSKNGPQHAEGILVDVNGNEIPILKTSVKFELGGRRQTMAAFIDISERKRFEEQIQQSRDQLAATNHELEAFSYSVSHDLQAPLRHIEGFSRLLMDDYTDRLGDEGREYLGRVMEGASRMSVLVNDLLKLSRNTRGEIKRSKVDLSKLAREIAERLSKEEPDRSAEFEVQPALVAMADGGMMMVVLENLIGNAWKFTRCKRNTKIEFGRTEIDGRTAYFVRDNGAGFKAGDTSKLFVPFVRLHNEKEFPGTGIGLATVQRIIHRHGGRVWAKGRKDKGATFYFTLS